MLFRYLNPFGYAENIYSLIASAFGSLRGRIHVLDRRHQYVNVLVERRA